MIRDLTVRECNLRARMRPDKNDFDQSLRFALARPGGGSVEERRIPGAAVHVMTGRPGATVLICLDGNGTAGIDGETFLARGGFIAILRGAAPARMSAGPPGLRWLMLHWPEAALQSLGPLRDGLDRTRMLYGRASVGLAWRISDELRVNDPLAPYAVDIMANGIALALTRGARSHPGIAPLARRARRLIEQAGYGGVSIANVARELGCTAEHVSRVFRRAYGLTPSRFVMWRRIEEAKALLLRSSRSVGDIAADLGFSDGSHFSRHFRGWTGVSPGRFRALQRLGR